MAILAELFNDDKIDKAIIITPGNELTSQWIEDYLDRFISTRQVANYLLYTVDNKTKNRRKEILSFLGASTTKYKHIMISNGSDYEEIVKLCQDHKSNKIILIHDEVHDLATPNKMMLTEGLHKVFEYRLGLSATIENDFSNEKKDFIEKEIGPCIKKYQLEDAIKDGVLSPFDYHVFEYELNPDENAEVSKLFGWKNGRDPKKRISEEQFRFLVARIHGKAQQKRDLIIKFLETGNNIDYIKKAFIFLSNMKTMKMLSLF